MLVIQKEELKKLYLDQKLSDQKIADRIGAKRREVTRLRQSFGIMAIEDYERFPNSKLTQRENEIILGLMLGDGHLRKRGKSKAYPELMIEQSIKHSEYLHWLRNEFRNWLFNKDLPIIVHSKFSKVTKTFNKSLCFRTVCHPVFNEFHGGFYPNNEKIVNFELLERYFTELTLAVWIMDDGGLTGRQKRSRLCTNGFTKEEVDKLGIFLLNRFGLKSWTIRQKTKKSDTWELRFDKESSLRITELVREHVVPSMQYKLLKNQQISDTAQQNLIKT